MGSEERLTETQSADGAKERPTHRRVGKCRFCKEERLVDYKDVRTLLKLSTPQGKMYSRKRSGNCAFHQRQFKLAVKRARFLGFLPYTGRQ